MKYSFLSEYSLEHLGFDGFRWAGSNLCTAVCEIHLFWRSRLNFHKIDVGFVSFNLSFLTFNCEYNNILAGNNFDIDFR